MRACARRYSRAENRASEIATMTEKPPSRNSGANRGAFDAIEFREVATSASVSPWAAEGGHIQRRATPAPIAGPATRSVRSPAAPAPWGKAFRKTRGSNSTQISLDNERRSRARATIQAFAALSIATRTARSRARAKGSTRKGLSNTAPTGGVDMTASSVSKAERRVAPRTLRYKKRRPLARTRETLVAHSKPGDDEPRREEVSEQAGKKDAVAPRTHGERARLLGHGHVHVSIKSRKRESIPRDVRIEVGEMVIRNDAGPNEAGEQEGRDFPQRSRTQAPCPEAGSISARPCAFFAGSPSGRLRPDRRDW